MMMNPQNLQYSFMFEAATSVLCIILLMNLARSSASSTPSMYDSPLMYESCKPVSCEKGPNITYPYYLDGHQNESCGYPSFKVRCYGGYPTGYSYIIKSISDYGTSATVVNNATLNQTCPVPLGSPSEEASGEFLKLGNSTGDIAFLCFFNNCSSPTPKNATEVSCQSSGTGIGNGTKLFVGLSSNQYCDKFSNWSGNYSSCKSLVVAPVEVKNMKQLQQLSMIDHFTEGVDYVNLLKGGFPVRMKWDEEGCKRCQSSGGRCGYDKNQTSSVCHCPDRTHLKECRRSKGKKGMLIGLGVGGIGGLAVIVLFLAIYMFRHRRKYKSTLSQNSSAEDSFGGSNVYFEVPIFSNDELEQATNNFDSSKELGDGGYGTVYYGKLRDGREVAVKRLYEHNYRRVKQFMTEVQILTRLRHTNLVSLYGCTSRRSRELLLVYEYVANGTVADHLHGDRAKPGSFPWPLRMNIAVETAKALAYLHKEGIIHRDVKTTNILLDKNFSVKVGDFGISRLRPTDATHVSTAPQGTPGYVDPEYHLCYQLTEKSDVYSFGVVLVELVSSMPAVDISRDRHEINLANLAVNKIQKRELDELIDPKLNCESDDKIKSMVTAVIELSFRCLQQDRELRPTMDEVVEELENAVENGRVAESRDPIVRQSNVSVDAGKAKTTGFLTSPESDEAVLLNKVKFSSSPISVIMQNWTSSSSSINSKSTLSTL